MSARPAQVRRTLPMAQLRQIEHGALPVRPKSSERLAVEAVLRTATLRNPISAKQVVARCGLTPAVVRTHISNSCSAGLAYNVAPGVFPALYAWGQPPAAAPVHPRRVALMREERYYDGAELRPFTGRPGAMHAFDLPSVQNGQRVERARPCLISSQPDKRR